MKLSLIFLNILKLDDDIKSINTENKNWYIPKIFPATKINNTYMYKNATINLFLSKNKSQFFVLEIALSSYYNDGHQPFLKNLHSKTPFRLFLRLF